MEQQTQTDMSHEDLGFCRMPENEIETNGLTQKQGDIVSPNCEVNKDASACKEQNEKVEGNHCQTRRYPHRGRNSPKYLDEFNTNLRDV